MIFLRKINGKLWIDNINTEIGDLPSRLIREITSSEDSDISLWLVDENNDEQIENIALIMANIQKSHDAIEFLFITEAVLKNDDLLILQEDNETRIFDYNNKHWNIKNLTYSKLGLVADKFLTLLRDNSSTILTTKRYKMKDICRILEKRIEENIISIKELNDKSGLFEYYENKLNKA